MRSYSVASLQSTKTRASTCNDPPKIERMILSTYGTT
jgi:hypothetical protein